MFADVSSSYYEGRTCPLMRFGYNRDRKRGKTQLVYAVLSAPGGCPVAIQAYPGNTADPNTVADQVVKLQERFGLERVVLVGDRGLLTQVQIEHLKRHRGLGWVSALKSLQIRALVEQDALQLSLLDEQNLAEIVSEDYPSERLVACYNPLLAEERSRKREELLAVTEAGLERVAREAARRTRKPLGVAELGRKVGRVLGRHKMGKHFEWEVEDGRVRYRRNAERVEAEARLDGIYVLRTSEPAARLSAEDTVRTYKGQACGRGAMVPLPQGARGARSPHPPSRRASGARASVRVPARRLRGMAPSPCHGAIVVRGRDAGSGAPHARPGHSGQAHAPRPGEKGAPTYRRRIGPAQPGYVAR